MYRIRQAMIGSVRFASYYYDELQLPLENFVNFSISFFNKLL